MREAEDPEFEIRALKGKWTEEDKTNPPDEIKALAEALIEKNELQYRSQAVASQKFTDDQIEAQVKRLRPHAERAAYAEALSAYRANLLQNIGPQNVKYVTEGVRAAKPAAAAGPEGESARVPAPATEEEAREHLGWESQVYEAARAEPNVEASLTAARPSPRLLDTVISRGGALTTVEAVRERPTAPAGLSPIAQAAYIMHPQNPIGRIMAHAYTEIFHSATRLGGTLLGLPLFERGRALLAREAKETEQFRVGMAAAEAQRPPSLPTVERALAKGVEIGTTYLAGGGAPAAVTAIIATTATQEALEEADEMGLGTGEKMAYATAMGALAGVPMTRLIQLSGGTAIAKKSALEGLGYFVGKMGRTAPAVVASFVGQGALRNMARDEKVTVAEVAQGVIDGLAATALFATAGTAVSFAAAVNPRGVWQRVVGKLPLAGQAERVKVAIGQLSPQEIKIAEDAALKYYKLAPEARPAMEKALKQNEAQWKAARQWEVEKIYQEPAAWGKTLREMKPLAKPQPVKWTDEGVKHVGSVRGVTVSGGERMAVVRDSGGHDSLVRVSSLRHRDTGKPWLEAMTPSEAEATMIRRRRVLAEIEAAGESPEAKRWRE
jgi:hypothetical protein